MNFGTNSKILCITLSLFVLAYWPVNAQSITGYSSGGLATKTPVSSATPTINSKTVEKPESIKGDKQIIDSRCTREKLLRGVEEAGQQPSEYSKVCCEDYNTETMIECMDVMYPNYDKGGLWGEKGFNFIGTDVVLTRETLPLIIRMVLTVVFALFALYYLWIAFLGFYEYLQAATESQQYEKAEKKFTSSFLGLLMGGGGILMTYIFFALLGFQGNPFDFQPIIDKSFLIDCESIETKTWCDKYDISCSWSGDTCAKVEPEVQTERRKSLESGYCGGYVGNFCENRQQ